MVKTLWAKLPNNTIARFFIVLFLVGLAFYILPFFIGGLLLYFLYKKINGTTLKVSTLGLVGLLTVFFGSAWVAGITASSSQGAVEGAAVVATQAPLSPTTAITPTIIESPTATPSATILPTKILTPTKEVVKLTPTQKAQESSSSDTYVNVDGNTIHSPVQSNTIPSGATAQCRDGSYSFSQHRSGTCSHHGGVARWL